MKTWIKRSLVAVFGASVLFAGIGAWAHRDGSHGWQRMSEAERAQMSERMLDRVGSRLDLDAAQKTKLRALSDTLRAQHTALMGQTDPRAEMQSLIAGPTFDRARAGALVSNKIAALQSGSPAVITAMADFYDSLNPTQQTKVREFMASRGGHDGHGAHHGHGERGEPGQGGSRN